MWRHSAHFANQTPIGIHLVHGPDVWDIESEFAVLRRKIHLEPVPAETAVTLVTLIEPALVRLKQRLGRIVEVGVNPAWIITGVKEHEAVELGHRHMVPLQVKDLRVGEICADDEQERKGKEDSCAPVPTPGKHVGMVA